MRKLWLLSILMLLDPVMGVFAVQAASPATSTSAASFSSSVYSAPNVHDFLIACQKDQGGCVDEVGNALIDKMHYDGSSHICLTNTDYGAAVPKWLGAHPETSTMIMEDGIYTALKALYPC